MKKRQNVNLRVSSTAEAFPVKTARNDRLLLERCVRRLRGVLFCSFDRGEVLIFFFI